MWEYNNSDELYHYGVLGMKWGQRKAAKLESRANKLHSKLENKKSKNKLLRRLDKHTILSEAHMRSIAKDLKSNQKVSNRQMKKNSIEARRQALRDAKQYNKKVRNRNKQIKLSKMSQDARDVYKIKQKKVSQMSNAELRKLNERGNLERQYNNYSSSAAKTGKAAVQAYIGVAGTIVAVGAATKTYQKVGKVAVEKLLKK